MVINIFIILLFLIIVTSANSEVSESESQPSNTNESNNSKVKNKKKISEYIIKTSDNSSYIILIMADKTTIYINVQNTEKIVNSFFEGTFLFDKLIQIDEYFNNFENNYTLYNYINYIFSNNKVNFNYENDELNIKMKFKVNERLKEITFPLEKRNMNKEQSMATNKILIKLVSKLQNTIKLKNEKINALRVNQNSSNDDIIKIKIESKIINNQELEIIEQNIKEEENNDSKFDNIELEFKLLFTSNLYEQNIINQLIDYSEQYENQCITIIEFKSKKICIIHTHKKIGNYCLIINENEKYYIKDFYIDKDKFYLKLEGGTSNKDKSTITKKFLVKDFIQIEFFSFIIINS
jgi:hypothetical protein